MVDTLIFLAFLWFVISVIRNGVNQVKQVKSQVVVPPPDWFATTEQLPESHVRRVGPPPLPGSVQPGGEESTSELMWDEEVAGHDLNLDHAEVVSLERDVPALTLIPRPLPEAPASLEAEVDWGREHERFHQRYVDARPQTQPTVRGLMDDLRDPAGARHAVLLAEILGPPVSMRK
jgi:hypothetical protein